MDNPYLVGETLIRIQLALPCSKDRAWGLIVTQSGYAEWFPQEVTGEMVAGSVIQMTWWYQDSPVEDYTILGCQDGTYLEHNWETAPGGKVRYRIEGEDPVVFTLEATYPEGEIGRQGQLLDLAPWSFATMNLKSVASGGPDLRFRGDRPRGDAYLD